MPPMQSSSYQPSQKKKKKLKLTLHGYISQAQRPPPVPSPCGSGSEALRSPAAAGGSARLTRSAPGSGAEAPHGASHPHTTVTGATRGPAPAHRPASGDSASRPGAGPADHRQDLPPLPPFPRGGGRRRRPHSHRAGIPVSQSHPVSPSPSYRRPKAGEKRPPGRAGGGPEAAAGAQRRRGCRADGLCTILLP